MQLFIINWSFQNSEDQLFEKFKIAVQKFRMYLSTFYDEDEVYFMFDVPSVFVNDYTVTSTKTSTSQASIHSLAVATYRSVEYTIQITEGTKYHVTKILAIHDGTNVTFNEYGTITTSTPLATFTLDINSGIMRLLATPASSNSTVFKVKFNAIKV